MAAPRILALLPLLAVSAAPLPSPIEPARSATTRASVRILRPLRLDNQGNATRADSPTIQRHTRACTAADHEAVPRCTMVVSELE